MDVIYKTSFELSDLEILAICEVFTQTFKGHSKTIEDFKNEFLNTELGYSYHGLLLDNGNIVGSQSYIPFFYLIDSVETLVALSVDTMIIEKYRNFDNIFDLWTNGHKLLKANKVSFIIGFPNEQAYPLLTKGMKEKEIGKLTTYFLPYKISSLNSKFKLLDFFSIGLSYLMVGFSYFSWGKNQKHYRIEKNRKNFNSFRYKWFDGNYKYYTTNSFTSVYKIKKYKGVNTAFLLDVFPMSKSNFNNTIRHIFFKNRGNFEAIIYVGNLNFTPISLIKLPRKFEPKTFYFTAKVLNPKSVDTDVVYDLNNWDVNLSNYDLI